MGLAVAGCRRNLNLTAQSGYVVAEEIRGRGEIGREHILMGHMHADPAKVHRVVVKAVVAGIGIVLKLRNTLVSEGRVFFIVIELGQDGGALADFLDSLERNVVDFGTLIEETRRRSLKMGVVSKIAAGSPGTSIMSA